LKFSVRCVIMYKITLGFERMKEMKRKLTKIIASFLCVAMLLTATPLSGFVGLDFSWLTDMFTVKASAEKTILSDIKSADIILILDTSGSMGSSYSDYAKVESETYLQESLGYYIIQNGNYVKIRHYSERIVDKVVVREEGWYVYKSSSNSIVTADKITFKLGGTGVNNEYTFYSTIKIDALKHSVTMFIDKLYLFTQQYAVDFRVAVTTFASSSRIVTGNGKADSGAFVSVKNDYENIKRAVWNLSDAGDSNPGYATDDALSIIKSGYAQGNRLFVTMYGCYHSNTSAITGSYAVISDAYQMKNTYGAKIYSIDVFDSLPSETSACYYTLNATSSNFPLATKPTKNSLGARADTQFYFPAVNFADLDSAFDKIGNAVSNYDTTIYSGTCGDNLNWAFDIEIGVLDIKGSGDMTDWSYYSYVPWNLYHSKIKTINIGNSVKSIGVWAFYSCDSLTDVYYGGSEEDWNKISIGSNNSPLTNATIHYNSTGPGNPFEPDDTTHYVNIPEDIVFIDVGEHYLFSVHDENGNDITNKLSWYSSTSVGSTGEIEICSEGDIKGLKKGLTTVHVSYWNEDLSQNLGFDSCDVYVGDPNKLEYSAVSDSVYYYGEEAFLSDACEISDSVDIFFSLENCIEKALDFYQEYEVYDDEFSSLDLGEYTITATVSGSNLSFKKDEYVNKYTYTVGGIPIYRSNSHLLSLFPHNLDVSSADKSFTVTLTIESGDFETITDTFKFKISSLEKKEINEHILFTNTNRQYDAMKHADFAGNMLELKDEFQYIWSKYSTLDFENYHDILMADVLVQLMATQKPSNISLLPVLKEWKSNYDKILSGVSTIVEDKYTGYMDVSENALDKLFKKSKYISKPEKVNDELRDTIIDILGTKSSGEKVNKIFGAIDKAGQISGIIGFGINSANDIIDYVGCISIMNAYRDMNQDFKDVIQKVYDCIPSSDWKVKAAVEHYVNLDTSAGYTEEIIQKSIDLAKNLTLEAFNSLFKSQFVSILTKSIGSIALKSGVLFSTTATFSVISTGLGAVATGASLGMCISDILCNTSGQSKEMSKVVAAAEFSSYIIQTLSYYDWALNNYKDEDSLKHFEYAFNLNKALQIYSIEHTYKALEIEANSLIVKLFSKRDYPGAMADLANLKTIHKDCNCCNDVSTRVYSSKTIAVKCPVDVYVYTQDGEEVVRIINNNLEYSAEGIAVFIYNNEKYITVPNDQEYTVKIIATDEGVMNYSVFEYDETGKVVRVINSNAIDLVKDQVFDGKIDDELNCDADSYALVAQNTTINPTEEIVVPVESVVLSDNKISLLVGESKTLFATVNPENATNKSIVWSSENESVATVTDNGVVTAIGIGTTTITALTSDGVIDTCVVEVAPIGKVNKVTINDFTVLYKDPYKLVPKIEADEGVEYTVTYTSSDNDVVTVDKDGNITTKDRGTATITVTVTDEFGNEVKDTCNVEVKLKWWQWLIWIFLWGWAWY